MLFRLVNSFTCLLTLIAGSASLLFSQSVDEALSMAVCGFRPELADGADVGYEVA